jgi:hypothetical protein
MDVLKHNERLDFLEAIIDAEELTGLMDLIAEVCSAKADHIREHWQDEVTANTWDGYAAGFLHCGIKPYNLPYRAQLNDLDKEAILFRQLSDGEELEFRQAARDQYKPGEPVESSWHPIYRDECRLINEEFS